MVKSFSSMKNAIWMEKINKIKNCIQVWKCRDLTLKGKVLIIKTMLLSQIGFIAETKIMPKYIAKTIETLLWNFLWNDKQPLVNRNTMYLNTESGGINMINMKHFIESKQIKFIYKIISSEYANWNIIGKNWLKRLDRQYNIELFLCKCSNIKGLDLSSIPQFYRDCVTSWSGFLCHFNVETREDILNSQLYGNKNILSRNSPIFIPSFSKSNLTTVRDIWNNNLKSFHSREHIRNKLFDFSDWVRKFEKIKTSIPNKWTDILKSHTNASQTRKIGTM